MVRMYARMDWLWWFQSARQERRGAGSAWPRFLFLFSAPAFVSCSPLLRWPPPFPILYPIDHTYMIDDVSGIDVFTGFLLQCFAMDLAAAA